MSLSPSGLSGSTGMLRKALSRAWTLCVGARMVMGESGAEAAPVENMSCTMKAKNVLELALT